MSRHHSTTDTIAAIATPQGLHGGVGIVRISGPAARSIATRLFRSASPRFSGFKPHRLHHGRLVAPDNENDVLDEILLAFMPAPHSFTGEDVVELHCHGGPMLLATVLEAVYACGARPAERGEFTKRAFLNGRLDLPQAEAVAEAIAAPSREGLRLAQAALSGRFGKLAASIRERLLEIKQQLCLALDFSEEDIEEASPEALLRMLAPLIDEIQILLANHLRARAWREGSLVVLAGLVNAGKSSLLNALLGFERAIVTAAPGTTRDYLEETLLLDGLPVRLVDTAGLRATGDIVELQGLERSRDLARQADLLVLVHDAALPPRPEELELLHSLDAVGSRVLAVRSKCDLPAAPQALEAWSALGLETVAVSSSTGQGIEELAHCIRRRLAESPPDAQAGDLAPNLRQSECLRRALIELQALRQELLQGLPYDLCDLRLEAALRHLAAVTGHICPDDVLEAVFQSFCIGK